MYDCHERSFGIKPHVSKIDLKLKQWWILIYTTLTNLQLSAASLMFTLEINPFFWRYVFNLFTPIVTVLYQLSTTRTYKITRWWRAQFRKKKCIPQNQICHICLSRSSFNHGPCCHDFLTNITKPNELELNEPNQNKTDHMIYPHLGGSQTAVITSKAWWPR